MVQAARDRIQAARDIVRAARDIVRAARDIVRAARDSWPLLGLSRAASGLSGSPIVGVGKLCRRA